MLKLFPKWLRPAYQVRQPSLSPAEKLAALAEDAGNAIEFLNAPAAVSAYQRLLQKYADEIMECSPADRDRRELAYMKAHLLQEMVREMAGAVHAYRLEKDRQAQA